MNGPKELTRKSLESVFIMKDRKLMAMELKENTVLKRMKSLVMDARESGDVKEVTGRMRAIITFLEGNPQAQFQFQTSDKNPEIITTYNNLIIAAYCTGLGVVLGYVLRILIGKYL